MSKSQIIFYVGCFYLGAALAAVGVNFPDVEFFVVVVPVVAIFGWARASYDPR